MDWGEIWDSTSEVRAEAWDMVLGVGQAVVAEKVQGAKESGKDPEIMRVSEPVKGKNADGSTIVVPTQVAQPSQPMPAQYVDGIDNRLLIVGGVVAVIVLAKAF